MISSTTVAILLALPVHAGLAEPTPPPPAPFGVVWDTPPDLSTLGTEPSGTAALSKTEFTVQTKDTVQYVYTVGEGGMTKGDYLRVEDPWAHGIRWSKYGAPHLDEGRCTVLQEETDKASVSLVTVSTSGSATVQIERSTDGNDLHTYAYTDVWLESGDLIEGDTITLTFGDTSTNKDCGHQFSDRAYSAWEWRAFENIEGDFTPVAPYPTHDIVSEREPAMLWVSVPSHAQADEAIVLKVAVLDRLGNPIHAWGETATVAAAYGGDSQSFDEDNQGWLDFSVAISDPGVHRIEVTAGEFAVSSNPVVISEDAPERRLFWGDLHSHHGHTITYEDGSSVDENHVYSRDVMGHDLGCESIKMDPIEIDGANLWAEVQERCVEISEDGSYLVVMGTEWMSGTSGTSQGHHNVYFDDCVGIYGDHSDISGFEGDGSLLAFVRDLEASQGTRSVVLPHAMPQTGKNWEDPDLVLRSGAEVYSEWGNTVDCPDCNRGSAAGGIARGLSRGHRFGFYAASDNHDGWFGNPLSFKYELAGLAGFWTTELTHARVFDALANRQTIATSGSRIIVEFGAIEGSSTVQAGEEIVAYSPTFTWSVHGTDTIASVAVEAVKLHVDSDLPEQLHETTPLSLDDEGQYEWSGWDGSTYAVFLSVTQDDGELAWSSPVWITQDCESEFATDPEEHCEDDTGDDTQPPDDTGPTDTEDSTPDDTHPPDTDTVDTDDSGDDGPGFRHPCGSCTSGGALSFGFIALGLGMVGAAARRREG